MRAERVFIPGVFGFSEELTVLLEQIPSSAELFFCGNYFNYGPNPLEVFTLLENVRRARQVRFFSSNYDRSLLIACRGAELALHERPEWISPYYGVSTVLSGLGLDMWGFADHRSSELRKQIKERFEQVGILKYLGLPSLDAMNLEKMRRLLPSVCPFGDRIIAVDEDSNIHYSSIGPADYYRKKFLPWMYQGLSEKIYSGRYPVFFGQNQ
ncbi:MAG: hypothetical protein IPJ84_03185 [Bdellovibrionales bacterium]|nr:hypothetical protein [Bdellovibrionales bacterium]